MHIVLHSAYKKLYQGKITGKTQYTYLCARVRSKLATPEICKIFTLTNWQKI